MTIDARKEIEQALGRPLNQLEWDALQDQGYAEDLDLALVTAKEVANLVRGEDSARTRTQARAERPSSPWHKKRAEILGSLYGAFAQQEPSVVRLRTRLDPERPSVPGLGSWIVQRYYEDLGIQRGDRTSEIRALSARRASGDTLTPLWYDAGGRVHQLQVPSRSTLGNVATVANMLSESYRWHEWESTRWLLCEGDPPVPRVFRWWPQRVTINETDTTTRLLLEVDPILKPEEVGALYAAARSTLIPNERVRSMNAKALALAEFSLESPADETWNRLRVRWNRGPGRRFGVYRSDGGGPSNFRRDVNSALERLITVGWRQPAPR